MTPALGKILVVDDEAAVRQVTRLTLSRAGYEIAEAEDGAQAIALLESGNYADSVDTIVCDLKMPHVSGDTAIAYFHSHHPAIPVIVMSGASDEEIAKALMGQGIGDYLLKPISHTKLLSLVTGAVRLRQLRRSQSS